MGAEDYRLVTIVIVTVLINIRLSSVFTECLDSTCCTTTGSERGEYVRMPTPLQRRLATRSELNETFYMIENETAIWRDFGKERVLIHGTCKSTVYVLDWNVAVRGD